MEAVVVVAGIAALTYLPRLFTKYRKQSSSERVNAADVLTQQTSVREAPVGPTFGAAPNLSIN